MFRGTRRKSASVIAGYLDRLGGELNAYTTKEEIVLHATVLKEDLGKAARLLFELATEATFPDGEIETERGVVLDEIISYKDNPAEDVYDKFEGMLFDGHPLGRPILGTTASVRRLKPDDLRAFVKTFFTPDRMAFTVVADIDEAIMEKRVLKLVGQLFEDFSTRPDGLGRNDKETLVSSDCVSVISSGAEGGVEKSVAPAPAPVTPAPAAPARARRAPKNGSALSLGSLLEEKKAAVVEETAAPTQEVLPDDEAVKNGWKALIEKFASRPRLASALENAKLRMQEENGVKSVFFTVFNAAQKQWIEEKLLRDLENTFRELLSCRKVNLHVDDIPEEEPTEKKPYMPEEKAKDLMDKHPEMRAFVADLGLDTTAGGRPCPGPPSGPWRGGRSPPLWCRR